MNYDFDISGIGVGDAFRRRSRLRLAPAILRAYCQTPRIDGSVRHHPPRRLPVTVLGR
ncbi:MAG: hypothetical protein ABIJ15_08040 [bacterium]